MNETLFGTSLFEIVAYVVAGGCLVALPFLHAAERRATRRDRARHEALMERVRTHYRAELDAAERSATPK